MAEYIEREAVLKIVADNCPRDKCGYNTEEEMGAGAACYYIRKAVETVPAADVVPKAEYEAAIIDRNAARLGMIAEHERLKTARAETAREIFEEIETVLCYSVYPKINANRTITPKRSDDFHIRRDDYNTIKKKYTEGAAADETKVRFTPEDVRKMSRAEVADNFTAIMESMKEW